MMLLSGTTRRMGFLDSYGYTTGMTQRMVMGSVYMILLPGTTRRRGSTAPLMVGSHAAWAPARADTTHLCLSLTESSSETTTHLTTGNCSTCSDNSPGHHHVGWMKCPESLVLCLIVNHFAVITFFKFFSQISFIWNIVASTRETISLVIPCVTDCSEVICVLVCIVLPSW